MNAEQIRDEYLAKAREEARASGRDVEVTSIAFAQACSRITELEGARAKAIGKPAKQFAFDEEWLREANCEIVGQSVCKTVEAIASVLNELDRRADVISQKDAELERLRAENQELHNQFITNAQRLGSVCYSWHNWAVEIVGKEAARRMSGQDMRDEIARRLAGRTTDQAEPRKRRGPGPDGPPKAGDPQDVDKDGDL